MIEVCEPSLCFGLEKLTLYFVFRFFLLSKKGYSTVKSPAVMYTYCCIKESGLNSVPSHGRDLGVYDGRLPLTNLSPLFFFLFLDIIVKLIDDNCCSINEYFILTWDGFIMYVMFRKLVGTLSSIYLYLVIVL